MSHHPTAFTERKRTLTAYEPSPERVQATSSLRQNLKTSYEENEVGAKSQISQWLRGVCFPEQELGESGYCLQLLVIDHLFFAKPCTC